jgi:hypothetical protein
MVHKFIDAETLTKTGYPTIRMGTHVVSYCEVCKQQQVHFCTGQKGNLYRFECQTCRDRLRVPRYR